MHSDVKKQIDLTIAMHEAYLAWFRANESGEDNASDLYYDYIDLKDLMNDYVPDPSARF